MEVGSHYSLVEKRTEPIDETRSALNHNLFKPSKKKKKKRLPKIHTFCPGNDNTFVPSEVVPMPPEKDNQQYLKVISTC